MIDLHMHTCMSDGTDTPQALVERVEAAGCAVFSVTDHDDLRANAEVLAAMRTGAHKARFVTGCEISSVFEGRNLHLLCYGFDPESPGLRAMIAEGAAMRRERVCALFEHLKTKHGIDISKEDRADILSHEIPGKVHIADAAFKREIGMTRGEFFINCLDDMDTHSFKLAADRVIETVAAGGGVVSFAHPVEVQKEYKIELSDIDAMAKRLKDRGLTAIEVYHSTHGLKHIEAYGRIAKAHGLYVSGGSDYHGEKVKPGITIGKLSADHFTPDDDKLTVLQKLR